MFIFRKTVFIYSLIWYVFHAEITTKYNTVQYSVPDDEHKVLETPRRQEKIIKALI